MREIARNLIDGALEKGEFDLVEDIAMPLPMQVIGELLGVPAEYHGKLAEWAGASAGFDDPRLRPEGFDPRAHVIERIAFFNELAEERRREPRDDLVTALTSSRARWPSAHPGRVGLVPRADPRCRDRHDPQLSTPAGCSR